MLNIFGLAATGVVKSLIAVVTTTVATTATSLLVNEAYQKMKDDKTKNKPD